MSKDQYSNNPDPFPGLEKDFYVMRYNKYVIIMLSSTSDEFITKTSFLEHILSRKCGTFLKYKAPKTT